MIPPSPLTLCRLLAALIVIPTNRKFSESFIVQDNDLFLLKVRIRTHFRNDKLFATVNVPVNLSPGQPKINRRNHLRSHSLVDTSD